MITETCDIMTAWAPGIEESPEYQDWQADQDFQEEYAAMANDYATGAVPAAAKPTDAEIDAMCYAAAARFSFAF